MIDVDPSQIELNENGEVVLPVRLELEVTENHARVSKGLSGASGVSGDNTSVCTGSNSANCMNSGDCTRTTNSGYCANTGDCYRYHVV